MLAWIENRQHLMAPYRPNHLRLVLQQGFSGLYRSARHSGPGPWLQHDQRLDPLDLILFKRNTQAFGIAGTPGDEVMANVPWQGFAAEGAVVIVVSEAGPEAAAGFAERLQGVPWPPQGAAVLPGSPAMLG